MYLSNDGYTYYKGTSQYRNRGDFFLLVSLKGSPFETYGIRALVRTVALEQLGHWMMGAARIAGKSYMVSGAYGADGLTLDVEQAAYDLAVPLPHDLIDQWSVGGGWNSAGSEVEGMRRWAMENLEQLKPQRRK